MTLGRGGHQPHQPYSLSDEAAMRLRWEETDESATAIGARFGVSKSVVISLARRRGWAPRGEARERVPTTMERLDRLHREFDERVRPLIGVVRRLS